MKFTSSRYHKLVLQRRPGQRHIVPRSGVFTSTWRHARRPTGIAGGILVRAEAPVNCGGGGAREILFVFMKRF